MEHARDTRGRGGADGDVRVLVADAHPPTRAGIRRALEHGGLTVCAEAATASEAIAAAREERPALCILDVDMPGNGIRAAAAIAEALPETGIVMLTTSTRDADFLDAVLAGASGYLMKDMDPSRLAAAVRGVLAGEAALPRHLVTRLLEEFRAREGRRRLPTLTGSRRDLTSRQWEVLQLLRDGLSTSEMAQRLFVSEGTIRSHVSAILRKLGVPDRAAAARVLDDR